MAEIVKTGLPKQIRYIVGNEAAERFSYYGMRSILVIFMIKYLGMPEHESKSYFHLFMTANYFLPLVGAFVSDRYWGKYKTIIYLSIVYCLGHLVLAIFEDRSGLFWGLALIAIGSGGIKPCVSAHVGDQFNETNQHLISKVFELFYWSVNFGSFFSTLLIPWVLPRYGPSVAFGIPGVLMLIATWVFWLGRKQYVHVPPTGKDGSMNFLGVVCYGLKKKLQGAVPAGAESFLDASREKYSEDRVEGAKAVMGVFAVFLSVIGFWALFDQHSSSWVLQAEKMDRLVWGYQLESSQIPALNPIMVMALIPLFSFGLYPLIEKLGIKVTPLRKMASGMVLTALSFLWIGMLQSQLDAGHQVNVIWQFWPFLILTAGEVLVSIPGLEFAYTQAPRAMKSTLMSFWLLTIAAGNFLAAIVAGLNPFSGAMEFYFWTVVMAVVSVSFAFMASRYKERSFIEKLSPGE